MTGPGGAQRNLAVPVVAGQRCTLMVILPARTGLIAGRKGAGVKRLTLGEWVEVAELVAAVGVIVSLLLLVYSLERNTAALQGGTENLLFESHTALASRMVDDASLVEIRLKVRQGEALSDLEVVRWSTYQALLLDVWAMAYMRHREELLAEQHWRNWDIYFTDQFRNSDLRLTKLRWEQLVDGFDPGFWAHVEVAVFGAKGKDGPAGDAGRG